MNFADPDTPCQSLGARFIRLGQIRRRNHGANQVPGDATFATSSTGLHARRPLGVCVAGGLLLSQLLTLYIAPVLYIYLDNLGTRIGGFRLPWVGRPSHTPAE